MADDDNGWSIITHWGITTESSFRRRRLLKTWIRRKHRITFKFSGTVIRLDDESNSPPAGDIDKSFVHYLSKNCNAADVQRMRRAIETQLYIWSIPLHGLVPTLVAKTMDQIESSRDSWDNEFFVELSCLQIDCLRLDHVLSVMGFMPFNEDASVPNVRRTDESAIRKVLESKVMMSSNENCVICLDKLPADSEVVSMPCSHTFHGNCIEKWLRTSHYCPNCRFEMPTGA